MIGLPTVSANANDAINQMAQLASELLERSGLKAKILPIDGYPMVCGEYIGDSAWPTVLHSSPRTIEF